MIDVASRAASTACPTRQGICLYGASGGEGEREATRRPWSIARPACLFLAGEFEEGGTGTEALWKEAEPRREAEEEVGREGGGSRRPTSVESRWTCLDGWMEMLVAGKPC